MSREICMYMCCTYIHCSLPQVNYFYMQSVLFNYLLIARSLLQGTIKSDLSANASSAGMSVAAENTPLSISCLRSSSGKTFTSSVNCCTVLPLQTMLRNEATSIMRFLTVLEQAAAESTLGVVTFTKLKGYKWNTEAFSCMMYICTHCTYVMNIIMDMYMFIY